MTDEIWAPLVPELICTSLAASRAFYCDLLGFSVRFARPEDGFLYLDRDGAQIMLEQATPDGWITAPLERPYGRGLNLQIEVEAVAPLCQRLEAAGIPLFRAPQEAWYRDGAVEHGQREMLVQDPDGYLLRLVEVLGTRPADALPPTAE